MSFRIIIADSHDAHLSDGFEWNNDIRSRLTAASDVVSIVTHLVRRGIGKPAGEAEAIQGHAPRLRAFWKKIQVGSSIAWI
jgi:hypothetical protein